MVNRARNQSAIWLFLIGLGSMTQIHIVGSIGISELVIFCIAPFIFIMDYKVLKMDGFMPFVYLSILTCIGCLLSSYVNNTPLVFVAKGFAHPYAIFAVTVVIHRLLKQDLSSFKWCLLGVFLSNIVSVFVFRPETYTVTGGVQLEGGAATAFMMSNPLFWTGRIKQALLLPFQMFYLKVPLIYTGVAILATVFISLVFSHGSGRAQAVIAFLTLFFVFIGGKNRKQLKRVGKNLFLIGIILVVSMFVFKSGYSYAARNGMLGFDAQQKYYRQTRVGSSILHLLMAGRMEFFCGVGACLNHPIFGFGPKGEDKEGYVEEYLSKYGSQEDYEYFVKDIMYKRKMQGDVRIPIPVHSHISMFWVFYGIFGLILWLYVFYLMYKTFRQWLSAVPQWYGFIAFGVSSGVWDILFNPFANRIGIPLLVSCMLFSKMISNRKMALPLEMEMEARKYG